MSLSQIGMAVLNASVSSVIELPIIKALAGSALEKASKIIKDHFLSSEDLAKAFQQSYFSSVTAIASGLALSQQGAWDKLGQAVREVFTSAINREFANKIESQYFLPYSQKNTHPEQSQNNIRKSIAEDCNRLLKLKQAFQTEQFSEIQWVQCLSTNASESFAEHLIQFCIPSGTNISQHTKGFLLFHGLIGNAFLHFFREALRRDERVKTTLSMLQKEGLWTDVKEILKKQDAMLEKHRNIEALQAEIQKNQEQIMRAMEKNDLQVFQQMTNAIAKCMSEIGENKAVYTSELSQIKTKLQRQESTEQEIQQTLGAMREASSQWEKNWSARFDRFEQEFHDIMPKLETLEKNMDQMADGIEKIIRDIEDIKEYLRKILGRISQDGVNPPGLIINPNTLIEQRFSYDPQNPIGEGAVGKVFRAFNKITEKHCALKILKRTHSENPTIVTRFLREALILYQFKNTRNIVHIYSSGGGGDLHFYIEMELLQGKPLSAFMDEFFSFDQILGLGLQICEALKAVHAAGIVHRDLNPNNLMWAVDGTVKLMDFGVARVIGLEGLTMHGDSIGTSGYFAPEQKGQANEATYTADVYSVGAILYRLATHDKSDISKIERKHLREFDPNIPEWFDHLVMRCLRQTPTERPKNAQELYERLQNAGPTAQERANVEAFKQQVSRFTTDLLGPKGLVLQEMLHINAAGLGLKKDDAESIIKAAIQELVPIEEQYKDWLVHQISILKETEQTITEEQHWDFLKQGVRFGVAIENVRSIIKTLLQEYHLRLSPFDGGGTSKSGGRPNTQESSTPSRTPEEHEELFVARLKTFPSRDLVEQYLQLAEKIIHTNSIAHDDPMLAMTVPQGTNHLSFCIGSRYVLYLGKKSKNGEKVFYFGFILDEHGAMLKEEGSILQIQRFEGKTEQDRPYWIQYECPQNGSQIAPELLDRWMAAVRHEAQKKRKCLYRKNHNSSFYKAANDPLYREILLNKAFAEATETPNVDALEGGKTIKEKIWESVLSITSGDSTKVFSPKEVIKEIHKKDTGVKSNTIRCMLISDCVNHTSRDYYQGGKDRYWLVDKGQFRLFRPESDRLDDVEERSPEEDEENTQNSGTKQWQLEFWKAFREELLKTKQFTSAQPRARHYFNIPLGKTGIYLSNVVNIASERIGVRLYIRSKIVEQVFPQIEAQKEGIEKSIGQTLQWNASSTNKDKTIGFYLDANMDQKENWPKYIEWLVDYTLRFERTFRDVIKTIAIHEED